MKNIFTIALLFICGTTLQAQLNKGTQLLTGNFNLGSSNQKSINPNDTNYNKGFGAGIGIGRQWVHKENRIRGVEIGYDYNNYTHELRTIAGSINSTRTSSQFYFGYVSQYLLPLGKKFFGTATLLSKIGFTKLNERIELGGNNDTNGELYRLSFGIQPGLAYQLSKRWIADVSIGNLIAANFEHSRSRNSYNAAEYKNQNTSFNLNSIFSGNSSYLGIGFRYILR